jgi:hypothetical protein
MAKLIRADLGTHYVLVSLQVVLTLAAGLGWRWAIFGAAAVIVGREVYGRWRRARPMTRDDWIESGRDAVFGAAGAGAVLAGAAIGLT